jgi:hypothetical protein
MNKFCDSRPVGRFHYLIARVSENAGKIVPDYDIIFDEKDHVLILYGRRYETRGFRGVSLSDC